MMSVYLHEVSSRQWESAQRDDNHVIGLTGECRALQPFLVSIVNALTMRTFMINVRTINVSFKIHFTMVCRTRSDYHEVSMYS